MSDREVADPLEADDFSSHAFYRDASVNGKYELVEFQITAVPTGKTPVFVDSVVDPLKAFMMGREYGASVEVDDKFVWASNPFIRNNPAYDAWHKGFYEGMSRNPGNTVDDPYYAAEIDDFIYPKELVQRNLK